MQEARSKPVTVAAENAELSERPNGVPTHARVRAFLESVAKRRIVITYQELANALRIFPPHSIHRVTEVLEHLIEKLGAGFLRGARGGVPGPGFFDCARRLGRFVGDPDGQDARTFHAAELNAVFACWGGSADN